MEAARYCKPCGGEIGWGLIWADIAAEVPAATIAAAEWTAERRVKEADRCADVIASGADILRAAPETAARAEVTPGQVCEAIVTGIGILACRPGGVGFMGTHWHSGGRCADCPSPGTLPLFDLPGPAAAPGVVFTPRALADEVTAAALGVVTQAASMSLADDIRVLRVVDPFCGSGAFLVSAARYLAAALAAAWDGRCQDEISGLCTLYGTSDPLMAARAMVIGHCVHGVDLDPVSVELAGLALQLLAPECGTDHLLEVDDDDYAWHVITKGASTDVTRHARLVRPAGPPTAKVRGLRAGDALVGRVRGPLRAWPPVPAPVHWPEAFPEVFDYRGGFDAVIGNPPFLGGYSVISTLGRDYREHLVTAIAAGRRTTVNLAVYCWLRMHQLASHRGVVGIVGPDGLLHGRDAQLAGALLEHYGWRPYRVLPDLRWPAGTAAVRVCMTWTSQWAGACPPPELRNLPERPAPAHLWRLGRTISTPDGPVDVYEPAQDAGNGPRPLVFRSPS